MVSSRYCIGINQVGCMFIKKKHTHTHKTQCNVGYFCNLSKKTKMKLINWYEQNIGCNLMKLLDITNGETKI